MARYLLRLTGLLLLGSSSNAANDQVPYYQGDPNFLFIGNSYTGQNNLPGVFTSVLKDAFPEWSETALVNSVNPGGQTFDNHLQAMETLSNNAGEQLADNLKDDPPPWKWVTLQDQSQVPAFFGMEFEGNSYPASYEAAIKLNDYIKATGGQTVFYMTWGRRDGDPGNPDLFPDYLTMQELLTEGYMNYMEGTSTPERPTYMAPVGLVFETIHNDIVDAGMVPTDEGTLFKSLYDPDGSHPSEQGTYIAALTILTTMFGLDPKSINWFPESIDEATARTLQDAVSRTVLETFESGYIQYPWKTSWTGASGGAGSTPSPSIGSASTPPTTAGLVSPPPSVGLGSTPPTAAGLVSPPPTAAISSATPAPTILQTTATPGGPTATPGAPAAVSMATESPTFRATISPTFPGQSRPTSSSNTPAPTRYAVTSGAIGSTPPSSVLSVTSAAVGSTPPLSANSTTSPAVLTNTTKGSITIKIQYDDFPEDIAWTFLQNSTSKVLFFQPYDTFMQQRGEQTQPFADLSQNDTYVFKISDRHGDGLCCVNGDGFVSIIDNNNFGRSTILFDMGETLGGYYEIEMAVRNYGQATVTDEADIYVPSTWPDLEKQVWAPVVPEPDWPGKFPADPTFSIVVNMDLDDHPREVTWQLHRGVANGTEQPDIDPPNDWKLFRAWNGSTAKSGTLNTTEVSDLQPGWYHFVVKDSAENGLCCTSNATNQGYVTLTGPLSATKSQGLIWGSDGNFGQQATIQFRMDQTGYVSHVQWDEVYGEEDWAPTQAPSFTTSAAGAPTQPPTSGQTAGYVSAPTGAFQPIEIMTASGARIASSGACILLGTLLSSLTTLHFF